jgi:hypothetical protein
MKQKGYIKNLGYYYSKNFNQWFLSASYFRNGEFNKISFKIDKPFKNEKQLRNFLNN